MKARKRKNVRARLSKRYARIVKDAMGSHDFYSWAPFVGGSADLRAEIVADIDSISARLDEVCGKFGLALEFVEDES